MSKAILERISEQETGLPGQEATSSSGRQHRVPVPIVAIGASAGGLESIERFFQNIEERPGSAFIVVQHLSPDFKSFMPEILSKKTCLQVLTVTDQMPVQPDVIYLMPPRMNLVIEENILYLTEIERTRIPNKPIDLFFESLALDNGKQATAVVLSGTGSDGAEGIVRVHDAGGRVFVESPASAKFDGMPGAAIAKRIHDGEGTPYEIAGELFGNSVEDLHSSTLVLKKKLAASAERIHIFKAIENRYGVDFARYKIAMVNRRIDRRMTELNLEAISDYWNYIQENEAEVTTLYYEMLIGVTKFFRDPKAFELIKAQIARIVGEKSSGEEVRVWSAGCASGEEAYSLAVLFSDEIRSSGKSLHLKIFATDIDDEILGRAAAGIYRKELLLDVPERYRSHFAEKTDAYKVSAELRSKVVFARHNIMNDPPFAKLDMITCRNLLIYLDNDTQRQVLGLFYFSLDPSGTLFLGPSESLGKYKAGYQTIDTKWKIFSKSADTLPAVNNYAPTRVRTERGFPAIVDSAKRPASFASNKATRVSADGAYHALLDQYVPPGLLIDEMQGLLHIYGELPFPLSFKPGKVSNNLRSFLDESLCTAISVSMRRAKREKIPVEYSSFIIYEKDEEKSLDFKVLPVAGTDSEHVTHFLVTFGSGGYRTIDNSDTQVVVESSVNYEQVSVLEEELKNTKEHLQTTVEELESTNEELQSTNDELLASNEKLQSTNEELHSVNEELYTINAEYQSKITELNQLSMDEEHLFSSTGVGTIFIDQERRIRKFTPTAAELFNLNSQDHGRPFDHVTHQFEGVNFSQLVEQCINFQENVESEVVTRNGEPYLVKIVSYCDDLNQPDGVVLSFVSVQAVKHAEQQYRAMFQSSPVGIAGMKPDHSIASVNPSLIKLLGYSDKELLGQPLSKLFPKSEESTAARIIEAYVDGSADRTKPEQVASTVLRRDGTRVAVEISVNSVDTATGALIHLYVTDMTDRQTLMDSVELHRDELEALVEERTAELGVRTRDYEDLYENAPDMYASIDPTSATISKCNDRLAKMTGYDKTELIGMNIYNLYHPDCHADAQAAFEQFLSTGKVKSRQLQLRLKSGERMHVLLNVDAVRDEDGTIIQSRSTWVDISDVQLLREENTTFLLATKGSDIGIWDWNFETGDQHWSDKFHELLGYPEDTTTKLSFETADIVHSDDRKALTKLFKSHFSGKSTFDAECRLKTYGGHYVWFHLQGRAVRGAAGKVERMVGSAQNVHAARKAKDELSRQAEIHRFITHETNDGWWDWNSEDNFQYMSPRFWETFGIDPSSRTNSMSEWNDIIHPDDLEHSIENVKKQADSGRDHPYVQEVRYRHAEGHWVTVICKGRVVERDSKGNATRMVGVHTDVTRLKQQEDQLKEMNTQLEKSNEDLERFAYITSHDLKAPLRGISTLVGFMEEDLSAVIDNGSEEANSIKDNLARLGRQASRMEGLITGVLDYSRVDSAGASVERIGVRALLSDLAIDHQLEIGRQLVLPDNLPTIKTDAVMFEQVFGNLMSNAAKFHPLPEELVITIECERAGDNYVFSVLDNGPGIAPDYHERIFDMFQTLHSKDTYESTGIGLTLVKRIVEKFGGEIWVQSREGEGAKFLFSWPAEVDTPVL